MVEEKMVVLSRSDNSIGFGFSLLGEAGLPHIIYEIEEGSPADRSGEVEAGDVILKVNGTDVNRFSTREVLKCLRLSSDSVTLKLKKDPQIKASVRRFLSNSTEKNASANRRNHDRSQLSPPSSTNHSSASSNGISSVTSGTGSSSEALIQPGDRLISNDCCESKPQPKFEAYMMTGELMLNLSRMERSQLHPHHHHHLPRHRPYHRYNSTPASPIDTRISPANTEPVQRYNSSPAETGLHNNSHDAINIGETKVNDCFQDKNRGPVLCANSSAVRTSRSEDPLQKEWSLSTVGVDLEDDVTSSLNTLLDPRADSDRTPPADRIVWTYNAPVTCNGSSHTSNSTSLSDSISQSSSSPPSPPSVSSSLMSSRRSHHHKMNGDMSLSEAVSNISSPDYQEQGDVNMAGRDMPKMELSDPSDSDSTILASEPRDYRLVIQVKGPDKAASEMAEIPMRRSSSLKTNNNNNIPNGNANENGHDNPTAFGYQELKEAVSRDSLGSDEGSDVESLHSFHYSPKAVDIPSAERLAKRLYHLDGFKKSDVSRHLSKNNEFSRAVAEEYVRHFDFTGATLDGALRTFLSRFALSGETQERERVLVHFSKRYLTCNPDAFPSQDAVHTLTCAIMLLNTDLHGSGATFRRMTCSEFITNLSGLCDGADFSTQTLKALYHAVKGEALQWALDVEAPTNEPPSQEDASDEPPPTDYKKGYVMRKCCLDPNGKKTAFGKRGWKMFYCTLRDLVLYLHKDEHGSKKGADGLHNAIRIHHALATKASDYTKKQHVFRLQTADQAEYLFQTSDSKELTSWIESINWVCARWSATALPAPVGSQRKLQRPLLPATKTKLLQREQLTEHESKVTSLESELNAAKERDPYLLHELKRYRSYVSALKGRPVPP